MPKPISGLIAEAYGFNICLFDIFVKIIFSKNIYFFMNFFLLSYEIYFLIIV